MKFKLIILLLLASIIFIACQDDLDKTSMIKAILWHKTSAEYRALCYQSFNLAKIRLDEDLQKTREKQRAIVIDLDETVFDNTELESQLVLENVEFHEIHDEWVSSAKAKAVPGALEFLSYADSQNCKIFYLSNRKEKHLTGSLKNLEDLGFPQAKAENLSLKSTSSDKGIRRDKIAESYDIVLLIGDNLIDFDDIFRKKTIEERFTSVKNMRNQFGRKFIILPNAMYGEWVKTLYGGTRNIPASEKEQLLWKYLRSDQ